jgi:hypothetical protein
VVVPSVSLYSRLVFWLVGWVLVGWFLQSPWSYVCKFIKKNTKTSIYISTEIYI